MIISDTSIRHSSSTENTATRQPTFNIDSRCFAQSGTSEIGMLHQSLFQLSPRQVGISQVSMTKGGLGQISSLQLDTPQNSIGQVTLCNLSTNEVTVREINSNHWSIQNRPTEISITQDGTIQITSSQKNASEISLPSSIPSEQFVNGYLSEFHDESSQSIYDSNNTALTVWEESI